MIGIGEYNELSILRQREPGLFLGDEQGDEVLLPNRYVPDRFQIGDKLRVFVYLDNEERPIATTEEPFISKGEFALLRCSQLTKFGAFLDFGLTKELFCPFKEQAFRMTSGQWYLVYCYLDEETGRLVASSKTKRFLNNDNLDLKKFDVVEVIISHPSDVGMYVIVNNKHLGLIHTNDLFKDVHVGDRYKGVVKKVRPDNKLDIVLEQIGYKSIEPNADKVLERLKANDGFLGLNDKSAPDDIKHQLQMSKKSFKKAIGHLYKLKQISITEEGISLN
ncbi:MAG: GntR family transcriptional regulator [Flavobacteriaceae bacterium]|nr:GntR family transcriptional regulator [Flavobacteriaceae bacterium]